jgi:hypothetical protein
MMMVFLQTLLMLLDVHRNGIDTKTLTLRKLPRTNPFRLVQARRRSGPDPSMHAAAGSSASASQRRAAANMTRRSCSLDMRRAGRKQSSARRRHSSSDSIAGAGKSAIVRRLEEEATFESSLVRVRLDPDRLLPEFGILYLSTPRAYRERLRYIRQVAVSGVSGKDIADFPILCPSLGEQAKIVERARSFSNRIQTEKDHLAKLKSIRQGLRDDLLTGRIHVATVREAAE